MSLGSRGLVSIVGAGPGDPDLLTLKGRQRLEEADVVLFGSAVPSSVFELCAKGCDLVSEEAFENSSSSAVIDFLVHHALRDKRVVRLKRGCPLLFGQGTDEIHSLSRSGVPFEIIPGVSSGTASAAYSGIPLLPPDRSGAVSFVEYRAQSGGSSSPPVFVGGTLVAFVTADNLHKFIAELQAAGWDSHLPCAAISHGTTPLQRTVTASLAGIIQVARQRGLQGQLVVVIGETVSQREQLAWFDRRPLWGRRILVTRAEHQAQTLVQGLRDRGAGVLRLPVLAFAEPTDPDAPQAAIERLAAGEYDWVIFTSANAVQRFDALIRNAGYDNRIYARSKLACVGPSTQAVLAETGLVSDLVPSEYRGEGVLRAFQQQGGLSGVRCLLPRAEHARNVLPNGLLTHGAHVDTVSVYRTIRPEMSEEVVQRHVDLADTVTFTSPSSVHNLIEALGPSGVERLRGRTLAAIGPITSRAILKAGLEPTLVARSYTVDGLVDAIVHHAESH